MIAICSDLDETPDARTYFEIARYLSTHDATAIGLGVGLEVGNSIYFDMPPGQFAYWSADAAARERVRRLMASGHIDCLHSYGDLARTRADVERDLAELDRHNCRLEVWVDHSKAPTNFGPDIMRGSGDIPGAVAYHADLTLGHGIRYVWRGRTTGVTGQDAPVDAEAIAGLFDSRHSVVSSRTMAKEAVKVFLGAQGHPRWRLYAENKVVVPGTLRDGRRAWEFLRSNPYYGGSGIGDTPDGIGEVLSDRMLDRLVHREGACVLYTHLGKVADRQRLFPATACAAFERLAARQQSRKLLVATTRRLLGYVTARDGLRYATARIRGRLRIDIECIDDAVFGRRVPTEAELQGITIELPSDVDVGHVEICIAQGGPIACETIRRGKLLNVMIPWRPLPFPEVA